MKAIYEAKTKNEFTPFRLIVEFETEDDYLDFLSILLNAEVNIKQNAAYDYEKIINRIYTLRDVMKLKITQ
jgi:hypothetical protein